MKRYILFGKRRGEAQSFGWDNFIGTYNSVEDSKRAFDEDSYTHGHIIDTITKEVVERCVSVERDERTGRVAPIHNFDEMIAEVFSERRFPESGSPEEAEEVENAIRRNRLFLEREAANERQRRRIDMGHYRDVRAAAIQTSRDRVSELARSTLNPYDTLEEATSELGNKLRVFIRTDISAIQLNLLSNFIRDRVEPVMRNESLIELIETRAEVEYTLRVTKLSSTLTKITLTDTENHAFEFDLVPPIY